VNFHLKNELILDAPGAVPRRCGAPMRIFVEMTGLSRGHKKRVLLRFLRGEQNLSPGKKD
jgi:hypothetical protein